MICYIATRGRPHTKTYKLFESVGIPVLHFVEPQQMEMYSDLPNTISIQQNDKGISYARNFMLNYARAMKHEWVIFCDDDVTAFGIFNGKTVRKDASIWYEILDIAKKLPFEVIGINYQQHAWHEKKPHSINKKWAEVCVLLHVTRIHWCYDETLVTKEDRDFVLQSIKKGSGTLRFNRHWFACPNVGTNAGGLHEVYKAKTRDEQSAKNMVLKWHPFGSLKKKGERIDFKIDFTALAKHYKKISK